MTELIYPAENEPIVIHPVESDSLQPTSRPPAPPSPAAFFFRQFSSSGDVEGRREQLNHARESKLVAGFACLTCLELLVWAGVIAFSAYEIYLWYMFDSKPCEENLTLWLGINGFGGIINLVLSFGFECCCPGEKDDKGKGENHKKWQGISQAFFFCVFVWGAVMIYRIDRANHECPYEVYEFVWVVYIIIWVCVSIGLMFTVCGTLLAKCRLKN